MTSTPSLSAWPVRLQGLALAGALALGAPAAAAAGGKLLLTGGVSSIDGAAGGGLTPWAVIGSSATEGEVGGTAHCTGARTQDFALATCGVALALDDRFEFSAAQQRFDTGPTGTALGLPGLTLKLDIVGVKWRVAGEAILDADTWMPQVAVGLQAKRLDAGGLAPTLGALGADTDGVDLYASATKLLLGPGVLLNGTLRLTKANQNGLLGFGSRRRDSWQLQPEVSVAWLLRRDLAVGAEWRFKPDNLNGILGDGVLEEDDWSDLFVAWQPHRQLSLTAAWVRLGQVTPPFVTRSQRGGYLSLQLGL